MIRRFVNWLLYNYECCAECDWLEGWEPGECVTLYEEGGTSRFMFPVLVPGQRPRYDGDGAVL